MSGEIVPYQGTKILMKLDEGRRALAEARTIHEAKKIRDVAKAAADLMKQQQMSEEAVLDALELKLWAERRMGELLAETVNPGRPAKNVPSGNNYLPDGVGRKQSHHWQKVASVAEPDFRNYLATARESGVEPTTAGAMRLARAQERQKKRAALAAATIEPCEIVDLDQAAESGMKFGTIYADPPWQYGNQGTRSATDGEYPTMTMDELSALPVESLAAEQSHLHLWTTSGFIVEALQLVKTWGFAYKSQFIWVKPQLGIGNYWRLSHEIMLLGVRGGLTFLDSSLKSWLQADRTEHSRKPEEVRKLIERASPGPYLELFARRPAGDNWAVWGNGVERNMFDGDVKRIASQSSNPKEEPQGTRMFA